MTDTIFLLLHIICGAAFAITMAVMQLGVGPAMGKIPPSKEKGEAAAILQGRVRLAMDIVIVILTVTVLYFAHSRWEMIIASGILMVKVFFGLLALTLANLLHFYWRGKKQRLKAAGENEKFTTLSKRTLILEKVALVSAATAFILAIVFNHS